MESQSSQASESPYSSNQLRQYVEYIGLPPRYRPENGPPIDINLLKALHVCHITTIPYENLALHYSSSKEISIRPQDLFRKIVLSDGACRGGYCLEGSLLFLGMLQAYGFDVYPTGVRMRMRENGVPVGNYIGLVHIVLIVTFSDGTKYVTDVAFGGDGQTSPQQLIEDNPVLNLGTQENRYMYQTLPQLPARKFSSPQKYWVFQYRNNTAQEWNAFYCFTEEEYLLEDFDTINCYTSCATAFQRSVILAIKFLRAQSLHEDEEPGVTGKVMLINGVVKQNLDGRTHVVQECRSEDERIQALEKWFQIKLSNEQKAGIAGLRTELLKQ